MEGLLLIDNLVYGLYTLIEDKENQVILEGIYNRASRQFINKFTIETPKFPLALRYFDFELLFADNNNMLRVSNKEAIGGKSILFKECIINWPHIQAPLMPSVDDFPQSVRIPIIFRERIDT